jgi:hypothetical protein
MANDSHCIKLSSIEAANEYPVMAKKTSNDDATRRKARADDLRNRIRQVESGEEPRDGKPSPRELTDEAARVAWEKAQKKISE